VDAGLAVEKTPSATPNRTNSSGGASGKRQAASGKRQAASGKRQNTESFALANGLIKKLKEKVISGRFFYRPLSKDR
jgi:hypothetical protein